MLNEIDLKDWKPSDFPQPLANLAYADIFSFSDNLEEQFKFLGITGLDEAICSTLNGTFKCFLFPKYLKVVKWQL
jgi:hypothetical protein